MQGIAEVGSRERNGKRKPEGRLVELVDRDEVLGEAVKHLSPETRESAPEIPWADIAGLRDLIADEYFRIDMHRVLEIMERDLPPQGVWAGQEPTAG